MSKTQKASQAATADAQIELPAAPAEAEPAAPELEPAAATPEPAPEPEPAKAAEVEVRVLVDTLDHKVDDVITLTAEEAVAARAAGWADPDPAAVAFAKSEAQA